MTVHGRRTISGECKATAMKGREKMGKGKVGRKYSESPKVLTLSYRRPSQTARVQLHAKSGGSGQGEGSSYV